MKSALAIAVISLGCLYAFFHPCHGLVCYSCASINLGNQKCENITGKDFACDYEDRASYCIKVVITKDKLDFVKIDQSEESERLLRRSGFANKSYAEFESNMEIHRSRGYKVDIFTCHEDRCNGV